MDGFLQRLIDEIKQKPFLWDRNHEHFSCKVISESGWAKVAASLDRDKTDVRKRWKNLTDTYKKELRNYEVIKGQGLYTGCWRLFDKMSFTREYYLETIRARDKWIKKRAELLDLKEDVSFNETEEPSSSKATEKTENQHQQESLKPNDVVEQTEDTACQYNYIFIKSESDNEDNGEKNNSKRIDEIPNSNSKDDLICSELSNEASFTETLNEEKTKKRKAEEIPVINIEEKFKKQRLSTSTSQTEDMSGDVHFMMSLVPYLAKFNPVKKLLIRNEIQSLLIKELLCDNCKYGGDTGDKQKPICVHEDDS